MLVLFFLIPATIFLYLPTSVSFINIWTDENNPTYSHGFLLLLVSVFFIFRVWQKKEKTFTYQPSLSGMLLLLATSLLWFIAHIGYIQFVQQIALLFIIIFIFLSLLGYHQTKLFLIPLLLLLFAIPIWDFTNIYLREIAVYSVEYLLNLTGILSVSDGFMILIPAGIFEIVEGCSGQGQLIVALAISCIYVYIHPMRWYTSVILILAAALTAIITNVLRIYIVVLCGQYTNMQHYFVTTDHVTLGWVVFSIGMLVYFIIANHFLNVISSDEISTSGSLIETKDEIPLQYQTESTAIIKSEIPYKMIFLVIFSIATGPLFAHYYENSSSDMKFDSTGINLIDDFAGWKPVAGTNTYDQYQWHPVFNGADEHQHAIYQSVEGIQVELNRYHYTNQRQGKEAVSDTNKVFQEDRWTFISREMHNFKANDKSLTLESTVIESPGKIKKLIVKYYSVLGVNTSNPVMAKLLNIWGIIIHQPEISVYVIACDINDSYTQTLQMLEQFISNIAEVESKNVIESADIN